MGTYSRDDIRRGGGHGLRSKARGCTCVPHRFLAIAGAAEWRNFPELKQSLPSADLGRRTRKLIIDVCHNKYRLIAEVDFEAQELNIEQVLTHQEYNREKL